MLDSLFGSGVDSGGILEGFSEDSGGSLGDSGGGEIMAEFRGDSGCILVDFGVGSACILGGFWEKSGGIRGRV